MCFANYGCSGPDSAFQFYWGGFDEQNGSEGGQSYSELVKWIFLVMNR